MGETQQRSPPHAEGPTPSSPHPVPTSHNPSVHCYQHRACPCRALTEVAQPPATDVDINIPSPSDLQVLAPS